MSLRSIYSRFLSSTANIHRLNSNRFLHITNRCSSSMNDKFKTAQEQVKTLSDDPGNEVKLKLYALFKQGSSGACNVKKPGALDFVGKAKWNAWNNLGDMSQDDAKSEYVSIVEGLLKDDRNTADGADTPSGSFQTLTTEMNGKICIITLNRPAKKNALTQQSYQDIIDVLKQCDEDKNTSMVAITGAGDFYCSGNDLSNFSNIDPSTIKKAAEEGEVLLRNFVDAIIAFKKPIIGLLNGPAVGIAVTTLGLFDVVYASDKATLQTPMVSLGQTAEGCSSYTFPKLMGQQRANEMLLFCKKIDAQKACDWGLVTQVFPDSTFKEDTRKLLEEYVNLPQWSLFYSKQLIRGVDRELLHKVNAEEAKRLSERWQGEECFKAIMDFFSKKAKL